MNMDEKQMRTVEAMETYGGSFVKALARCFRVADQTNFQRLFITFNIYWREYEEMAERSHKISKT